MWAFKIKLKLKVKLKLQLTKKTELARVGRSTSGFGTSLVTVGLSENKKRRVAQFYYHDILELFLVF